jgi:hypothetical protein
VREHTAHLRGHFSVQPFQALSGHLGVPASPDAQQLQQLPVPARCHVGRMGALLRPPPGFFCRAQNCGHLSKAKVLRSCVHDRMIKLLLVMKPWLRARYAQKHGAPSRPHPPLFCLDKRLFSLAWHRRTCCRAPWRWHTRGGGRGPPASTRGWGSAPPRHATCRQDVQVQRASGVRRRRQRRRRVAALAPLG